MANIIPVDNRPAQLGDIAVVSFNGVYKDTKEAIEALTLEFKLATSCCNCFISAVLSFKSDSSFCSPKQSLSVFKGYSLISMKLYSTTGLAYLPSTIESKFELYHLNSFQDCSNLQEVHTRTKGTHQAVALQMLR